MLNKPYWFEHPPGTRVKFSDGTIHEVRAIGWKRITPRKPSKKGTRK